MGGINEAIDLSIQNTSANLSLSSYFYLYHQHWMDFLVTPNLHVGYMGT